MSSSVYLSVSSFCPCKIRALDKMFDLSPDLSPDIYPQDIKVKSAIMDIKILDHCNEMKNNNYDLGPIGINLKTKSIFNTIGYDRIKDLEDDTTIVLFLDNNISLQKLSKDLEIFLSKSFPKRHPRSFFNYCRFLIN